MKKKISQVIFLTILMTLVVSYSYSQERAVDHLSKVNEILDKSKDELFTYLKVVTKGRSARKIENKRQDLLRQIVIEINELNVLRGYNGDVSLRDAGISYLQLQKTILRDDYGKIMDLEELAEKSYDNMEMYLLMQEKANEKLHEASDSFEVVYKDFADNYDINLIEADMDKKSKRIKKMAETLHHYNELFLIQFKCHHQENYILEAMRNNDVNAIQQNINAQTALAEESIEKLEGVKPYENDPSLIQATRAILRFYKNEAEHSFTDLLDFYIKKDNFETIKKNFDAKSKSERDKESVDEFNNAVNEYNASIKSFNELNNRANNERTKQIKAWNDAAEDFNSEHSK